MLFGKKERKIKRLLVVEDEPLVAFDTEHFLTEEGFVVVATTDSVAEAVALLGAPGGIDLVLIDLHLADGTGKDVAHAARAENIPALFVTGGASDDLETLALGCLVKPYPQRDLLAAILAVEAVLEGKRPKRVPASLRLFQSAA